LTQSAKIVSAISLFGCIQICRRSSFKVAGALKRLIEFQGFRQSFFLFSFGIEIFEIFKERLSPFHCQLRKEPSRP